VIVHHERRPDDLRIAAEMIHPVSIAQQHHRLGADGLFARREQPSKQRLDAEQVEEVVGDDAGLNALRLTVSIELKRHRVILGCCGEADDWAR
jgi:hypothetical protein